MLYQQAMGSVYTTPLGLGFGGSLPRVARFALTLGSVIEPRWGARRGLWVAF